VALVQVELIRSVFEIEASEWDRIAGADDPFAEHAFLGALEASGSVGEDSGWLPLHVVARDAGRLVGALPLYVKLHSYGEYIFDWSWASAAQRAGIPYYPKLVAMAPLTPATGARWLVDPAADRGAVLRGLLAGVEGAAEQVGASSFHLLFLRPEEHDELLALDPGLMSRLSSQFHWVNEGYADFDAFVARYRSTMRKQLRRERTRAAGHGLELRVCEGPELGDREWNALRGFYLDTCNKHGSGPYLTPRFFDELRARQAPRVVAALAYRGKEPVAGSLNFQKGAHLYGRYWGATEELDSMHFELCYYRLIERAIAQGLTRFEAGAQGSHKLRRGLMPAPIHSLHWIRHPGLARAVADYLPRERAAVQQELAALAVHGPFRRGNEEDSPARDKG
jgi:predicted N-acyltransferase